MGIAVSNFEPTTSFILKALPPLGVALTMEGPDSIGLGLSSQPSLWQHKATVTLALLHVVFLPSTMIYTDYDLDLNSGRWAAMIDQQVGDFRHYWSKSQPSSPPWATASNYSSPKMSQIIDAIQL